MSEIVEKVHYWGGRKERGLGQSSQGTLKSTPFPLAINLTSIHSNSTMIPEKIRRSGNVTTIQWLKSGLALGGLEGYSFPVGTCFPPLKGEKLLFRIFSLYSTLLTVFQPCRKFLQEISRQKLNIGLICLQNL